MRTYVRKLAFALCVWTVVKNHTAKVKIGVSPPGPCGGTGTATDPFRTPDPDTFFNLMHDQGICSNQFVIPPYSTIHLMPGTFLVREGTLYGEGNSYPQYGAVTMKTGWKLQGAGMFVTTLKLMTNHAAPLPGSGGFVSIIRNPGINGSGAVAVDDVEVSDLTVDCNLQGQSSSVPVVGGVSLSGTNNLISRVRGINWGTKAQGYECFVLHMLANIDENPPRAPGYHNGVI